MLINKLTRVLPHICCTHRMQHMRSTPILWHILQDTRQPHRAGVRLLVLCTQWSRHKFNQNLNSTQREQHSIFEPNWAQWGRIEGKGGGGCTRKTVLISIGEWVYFFSTSATKPPSICLAVLAFNVCILIKIKTNCMTICNTSACIYQKFHSKFVQPRVPYKKALQTAEPNDFQSTCFAAYARNLWALHTWKSDCCFQFSFNSNFKAPRAHFHNINNRLIKAKQYVNKVRAHGKCSDCPGC